MTRRDVAALLHRDRREAGQRDRRRRRCLPIADHVTEREDLGVPGQRQVGRDRHAAGAVDLGAGRSASIEASSDAFTPGGPDTVWVAIRCSHPSAPCDRHRPVVDVDHRFAERHRHAEALAASAAPSQTAAGSS